MFGGCRTATRALRAAGTESEAGRVAWSEAGRAAGKEAEAATEDGTEEGTASGRGERAGAGGSLPWKDEVANGTGRLREASAAPKATGKKNKKGRSQVKKYAVTYFPARYQKQPRVFISKVQNCKFHECKKIVSSFIHLRFTLGVTPRQEGRASGNSARLPGYPTENTQGHLPNSVCCLSNVWLKQMLLLNQWGRGGGRKKKDNMQIK